VEKNTSALCSGFFIYQNNYYSKKMEKISEEKSLEIMRQCPRFSFCSVNKCPLDYFSDLRNKLAEEGKCTLAKSIRMRIGEKCGIPSRGLTRSEQAAMSRFEKLTPEEKEELKNRGSVALKKFKIGCSQK
jgi:hypothetical protein